MENIRRSFLTFYQTAVPFEIRRYIWISRQILFSPWPYLFVVLAVILNNLAPVKRNFKNSLTAVTQDFIWFLADAVFHATLIPIYAEFLEILYSKFIGFTIPLADTWPLGSKFMFSFLVFDFMQWLHHVIRHKVLYLWYFHTVHHSARTLTIFTDVRVHPVEFLVARTLTFIPLLMLRIDPFMIAGVGIAVQWYTRFYHADLKTNYGFLKYFMVTPQSHRIHHSRRPEHQDKNFGVIFTLWDRLFGTLYAHYEEYPETGITDEDFPLEKKLSPSLLTSYVRQWVYPFHKIFTGFKY